MQTDWSGSTDVEVVDGKCSGKPVVKDRRIPADMLMGYYDSLVRHGMEPLEAFANTDENYPGVGSERLKRLPHNLRHSPGTLYPMTDRILQAVDTAKPGSYWFVSEKPALLILD